ncbi:ubiquitin-like protein 4A isoform X1 [Alligator mississippiensis]|uniref:Ubiquitin-like protein 4A n=1 Tax=Alligator mississippiensis TaxID=8496 RepID=A0A151LZE0_ALLMI|nr:ubiquitin-like protein 4A isoform X1 [Alligator mississippiensis]KYO17602.1 ubiquitin-like protein 4A [Alligator mississippiensis]
MLLTVKALQGRECSLQVSPDERVGALKRLVAENLHVPVAQQRLLFKGKALADEHRLSDYAIGPESKLNLVIKPPEKASPEETGCKGSSPATAFPTLWPQLTQVLARHFSTADMEKVLEQLQKDYDRSLRLLSLDDIERLATRILHPDTPDMLEMGFLD